MENTACGCDCPFVKTGFCASDKECPNYVESWWKEAKTGENKLIRDCVPKRLMIQNHNQQIRLDGVQQALEQTRNECKTLIMNLNTIVEQTKQFMIEVRKTAQIQESNKNLIEDKSDE